MPADRLLQPNPRRDFLRAGSAAVAAMLAGTSARAQPAVETLHILSGAAPGSTPDIVARRFAEQLSGRHAQRAVVDNRPGAAGRIAVNALKLAPADGSTVWLASGSIATVNPYVHARLGYDPAVDLQPVSLAAEMPLALAVGPAVPQSVGNVRELVDWMRRNPALANVGSPGVGSVPHLLEALLLREADVAWQHVSYPGGAPAVMALLGGQIAVVALPEAVLSQHRKAGKLRVLATSGPRRSGYMPDVPSFVEQGRPDLVVQEWLAFFMHSRVPAPMVEATAQAVRVAVARPELAAAFADLGMVAAASTPAALSARIAAEQRVWEPLIRVAGIRAD